jgi:hypothetical protein
MLSIESVGCERRLCQQSSAFLAALRDLLNRLIQVPDTPAPVLQLITVTFFLPSWRLSACLRCDR